MPPQLTAPGSITQCAAVAWILSSVQCKAGACPLPFLSTCCSVNIWSMGLAVGRDPEKPAMLLDVAFQTLYSLLFFFWQHLRCGLPKQNCRAYSGRSCTGHSGLYKSWVIFILLSWKWVCGDMERRGMKVNPLCICSACFHLSFNNTHLLNSCVFEAWETAHKDEYFPFYRDPYSFTASHTALLYSWLFHGSALCFYVASHMSIEEKFRVRNKEGQVLSCVLCKSK